MRNRFLQALQLWRVVLSLLLCSLPVVANGKTFQPFSATEQTLTALLMVLAFILLIVLILYRRQKSLAQLLLQESRTDHLTKISNRRHFFERLDSCIAVAKRHHQPLSFLAIDIDHFKQVNDQYGHPAGDQILTLVAETLNHNTRTEDCLGRLGGEEFAVLLPMTDKKGSEVIAERVRKQVETLVFSPLYKEIKITISLGISTYSADLTATAYYQTADEALYRAKESGRNCVVHSA